MRICQKYDHGQRLFIIKSKCIIYVDIDSVIVVVCGGGGRLAIVRLLTRACFVIFRVVGNDAPFLLVGAAPGVPEFERKHLWKMLF